MSISELVVSIIGDMSKLSGVLNAASDQVGAFGSKFQSMGKSFTSAGTSLTTGVTAPIVAVGVGIGETLSKATTFDTGMRRVFTMLPGITGDAQLKISNQALQLSKDFGSSTSDMTNAMYQALSSGVPDKNVFTFMQDAEKLAIGGASDVVTTTDALTTAVNSYGAANLSTAQASDIMFAGTKFGKSTIDEIAHSMSQVVPLAASMGVGFGDVNASLATMTIQGTSTSEATTQLKSVLNELSTPTSKAAAAFKEISGKTFPEFIKGGGTVGGAIKLMSDNVGKTVPDLKLLQKATDDLKDPTSEMAKNFEQVSGKSFPDFIKSGGTVTKALDMMGVKYGTSTTSLKDYFSNVESMTGALQLSGEGEKIYAQALDGTTNSLGSTDQAYKTMSEGAGAALDRMKSSFDVLLIKIGQDFIPILSDTLVPAFNSLVDILDKAEPYIKTIADNFNKLSGPVKLVSLGFVAFVAALGPVLATVGLVATGIGSLAGLFAEGGALAGAGAILESLGAAILGLVNPVTLTIAAVVLLYEAFTHWDKIKSILNSVAMTIEQFVYHTVEQAKKALTSIDYRQLGADIMNTLLDGIETYGPTIIEAMRAIFIGIPKYLLSINWYSIGVTIVTTLKDGIVFVLGALGDIVSGAFSVIFDKLKLIRFDYIIEDWLSDIINSFSPWKVDLRETVYQVFEYGLVDTIKSTIKEIAFSIEDWLSDIINSFSPWKVDLRETVYQVFEYGLVDTIKSTLIDSLNYLKSINWGQAGTALWNSFTAGVNAVIMGPYNAIMGIINTIKSFLSGINLSSTGQTIWNTFTSGVKSVINAPYTAITGALAAIKSFLSGINLSSTGQNIWNTFTSGVKAVINSPYTAITSAMNTIKSYLSGINLYTIGYNIINSLRNGIVNSFSSILSTVESYVDDIKSAVTGAQSAASKAKSIVNSVPSGNQAWYSGLNNPNATDFATGGIITRPIYAHVGEAGTEAIIPLDQFSSIMNLPELFNNALKNIISPLDTSLMNGLKNITNIVNNSNFNSNPVTVEGSTYSIGPNYVRNDQDIESFKRIVREVVATDRRRAGIY